MLIAVIDKVIEMTKSKTEDSQAVRDHGVVTSLSDLGKAILESGGNEKWPESQTINGYELRLTCASHPEQYDVWLEGNQVAYFRLRHGEFRVDVPDCGGETIYRAPTEGDGLFNADERQYFLTEAVSLLESL